MKIFTDKQLEKHDNDIRGQQPVHAGPGEREIEVWRQEGRAEVLAGSAKKEARCREEFIAKLREKFIENPSEAIANVLIKQDKPKLDYYPMLPTALSVPTHLAGAYRGGGLLGGWGM